jgi:hypothetical protein
MTESSRSRPQRLYVWLVPSEEVLDQPGSWRIRKWDTEPFPEANFALSESKQSIAESHVAALTPDWCMDAFWRANPGRNATVPSLYLLDFAREVLRVHGVQSAKRTNGDG